jgi:hypothetical protein
MPLHCRLALRLVAALALLVLAGCGSPPTTPSLPTTQLRAGPGQALLLGEVHDNAAQHALRRDLLAALLARGDRPALLLEQFDRERQAALDAASQPLAVPSPAALDAQVDAVVQAGGAAPGNLHPLVRRPPGRHNRCMPSPTTQGRSSTG